MNSGRNYSNRFQIDPEYNGINRSWKLIKHHNVMSVIKFFVIKYLKTQIIWTQWGYDRTIYVQITHKISYSECNKF